MARPDFTNVWGSTNAPFTAITDTDYKAGWVFRTGAPPRRVNFDYFQNLSDQRHQWLGEQMLLAVGHEWQDEVSYDAYAIVRSPVNGQLYRSIVGSNLNNEPSVSGTQWELGLASVPDASETVKGIIELATSAEIFAGTDTTRAATAAGLLAGLLGAGGTSANDYATIPYRDKTTGVRRQLIVQWGTTSYVVNTTKTLTFPITYPNAQLGFVALPYASIGSDFTARSVSMISQSTANAVFNVSGGATTSTTVIWISIGW